MKVWQLSGVARRSRMLRNARAICSLLIGAGICAAWGCESSTKGPDLVCQLDRVAQSLDRYGFANISTAFLTGATDDFEFDLNKSASEYFDLALKPQGGFRHYSAVATDVQTAVRVNFEEAIITLAKLKAARSLTEFRMAKAQAATTKQALEVLVASNPTLATNPAISSAIGLLGVGAEIPEPVLPEIPEPNVTGPPPSGPPFSADKRTALAAVGPTFSSGLTMPEGAFQISAREALMIASGDDITQSLLQWFTKPAGNKLRNYELFFCPMVVSVQPGFETRENYGVDITVNVDLARNVNGSDIKFLSGSFPNSSPPIHVAGVFPVIDSQVLDLVNSRRQLFAMALQLSMLGFGSQADFFVDYAKKLETDARTATTLTAASAYTTGGSAFGFRIEPKLVASKDPTHLETRPGKILESRAFPAMAVILVDRAFLGEESSECGPEPCDESVTKKDAYQYLVLETSTRWIPLHGGRTRRYTEHEAHSRASALDTLVPQLQGLGGSPSTQSLSIRARALAKLVGDSRAIIQIESGQAGCVCVSDVFPKQGWWDQFTLFTLHGKGFNGNVKAVTVAGIPCDFDIATDRQLLIAVPPWKEIKKQPALAVGQQSAAVGTSASSRLDAIRTEGQPKDDVTKAEIEVVSRRPLRYASSSRPVVYFNRELPAGSGSSNPPKVNIEYEGTSSNIKGISVTGDYSSAAHLLELVRERLRQGDDCLKVEKLKVKVEGEAP